VTVWFAAVAACRYVGRLLEQVGAEGTEIVRPERIPASFDVDFAACLGDARGVRTLGLQFADRMTRALADRSPPARVKEQPGYVRFVPKRRSVGVEWLGANDPERVLWRETLKQFVVRMTREAGWDAMAESLNRIAASRTRHGETGRAALMAASPRLARTVEAACRANACAGLRVGTGHVRGTIPVSLWVYADPSREGDGLADVTVTVNRAHEEFILEGPPPQRGLFYFPPSVLVAKLGVGHHGLQPTHLPTILVPRGGARWRHPYSGDLRKTSFTAATVADCDEPALVRPSAGAIAMFPHLAGTVRFSRENDLCLNGQKSSVNHLFARYNAGQVATDESDVLGLATALHDIVRLGLTRGHCKNTSAPRISIRESYYPIPTVAPPAWLAHRVFTYDPNQKRAW
jgi:hypothetical protein